MKKQLFWVLVAVTVAAGFLLNNSTTSAAHVTANAGPSATSAGTVIAGWGFEAVSVSATPSTTPAITVGSATADTGAQTSGSSFTASHASASTVWSTPAGNGSTHSISSNNWGSGDYYQFQFSTTGFTNITLGWDQTGSASGPRDFKVQYSTNGTTFTDATGTGSSYQVVQATWASGTPVSTTSLTLDLSSVTSLNNQATVYIRLVNTSAIAINLGAVGTGGTGRVDNFVASGTAAGGNPTPTPAPAVTGVIPNTGTTAGGTSVTITGTNFTGATAVTFGGTAATNVVVVNDTQITATSPAHAAGAVDVTVTTSGGTSATSTNDKFTYTAGPGPSTVQFSASNYNIDEAGGHIDVTVTRSGDTSGAATVDYTTEGGGTASQKSDYEIALGTLSFAANQASQTFTVLIVDDKFVENLETINLQLSNPTGTNVTLGSQSTATISILENDTSATTTNPYDTTSFFVRQNYLDFLNREPDASGSTFWQNEINQCGANAQCIEVKRINVSAAFFLSIEFQTTGFEAYLTHKAAFGVSATGSPVPVTYLNFMHDTQELGKGYVVGAAGADAVLAANKAAYFSEFVTRSAFLTAYPLSMTNAQYVDKLLTTAGLPTTGTFRDSLVNGMNNSTETRASVLQKIAENSTLRTQEFNKAFVLMEYFGYLRRDPNAAPDSDYSGYNFWLAKLNQFNGDYIASEMVKAFITAQETRGRFGTP
jgi:hypothetical protein